MKKAGKGRIYYEASKKIYLSTLALRHGGWARAAADRAPPSDLSRTLHALVAVRVPPHSCCYRGPRFAAAPPMASSRDAKGSAAMVAKLAEMMDAGMHYEAQQMYQNAALRLGSHGQAAQARRLLRDGTGAMVAAGKVENAMALAKQYIEISADSPADDAAGAVEEVVRMCAGFPDGSETQQLAVLHAAIKWTAAAAGGGEGDGRRHPAAWPLPPFLLLLLLGLRAAGGADSPRGVSARRCRRRIACRSVVAVDAVVRRGRG